MRVSNTQHHTVGKGALCNKLIVINNMMKNGRCTACGMPRYWTVSLQDLPTENRRSKSVIAFVSTNAHFLCAIPFGMPRILSFRIPLWMR